MTTVRHNRPGPLGRNDVWSMALFDEVRIEGREVLYRVEFDPDGKEIPPEARGPYIKAGVLADGVTEEQAWNEIADAYSK